MLFIHHITGVCGQFESYCCVVTHGVVIARSHIRNVDPSSTVGKLNKHTVQILSELSYFTNIFSVNQLDGSLAVALLRKQPRLHDVFTHAEHPLWCRHTQHSALRPQESQIGFDSSDQFRMIEKLQLPRAQKALSEGKYLCRALFEEIREGIMAHGAWVVSVVWCYGAALSQNKWK